MNKVISAIALMCLSVGIHNALASSANELPIVSDKEEINSSTNNSDDELEGWMFYANAKLYYKDGGR